jgi:ribonuclease-3
MDTFSSKMGENGNLLQNVILSHREKQLDDFIKKFSLSISRSSLDEATTHDSYLMFNHKKASNERLETLGDAVCDLLAIDWLFDTYPEGTEGEYTLLRSEIVQNETLGKIAKALELEKITLAGKGAQINDKQLADSLEAIFGALFKQAGYEACQKFFDEIFLEILSELKKNKFQISKKGKNQNNPKNYLQEFIIRNKIPLPKLILVEESGVQHNKKFVSEYRIDFHDQIITAQGKASTKKESEKIAAAKLLHLLRNKKE